MKRFTLAFVVVLGLMTAPTLSQAEPVIDGQECSMTFLTGVTDRLIQLRPGGGSDADRFAICVSDGNSANGAELYVGGELRPELDSSGDRFCGAVIVGGRTLYGVPDWDRVDAGADPTETLDDVSLSCD